MRRFFANRWMSLVVFAVLFASWELGSDFGFIRAFLLPAPSAILDAGVTGLRAGLWNDDISVTLTAYLTALGFAAAIGLVLGVVMGVWKTLNHLFDPYIIGFNALPKVVLCPLVMLWFGTGMFARVFLGALMAIFPIVESTVTGVKTIDPSHVMLVRANGGGRMVLFRKVLLPSVLPHVLSGTRLGANYAMVGVLVVEFFASSRGIGYRLNAYSQNFQTDLFFVLLVLVIGFVLAVSGLLRLLEVRLGGWRSGAFQ